jgi:hypothetical protein
VEAFIWVREPSGIAEEDLAGLERHSRLASATLLLIRLVASGKPGIRGSDRPDSEATELFKSFLGRMSPDDFAQKYVSEEE